MATTADDILDGQPQAQDKPASADTFLDSYAPINVPISEVQKIEAGGDPQAESFQHYLQRNPTQSMQDLSRLIPLADTPEKKNILGRWIQDKFSPELSESGVLGDLGTAITTNPVGLSEAMQEADKENTEQEKRNKFSAELAKKYGVDSGYTPPSKAGQITRGVAESGAGLVDFLLSPAGIGTAGLSSIPAGAARAVIMLQKAAQLGFGAQMASALPGATQEILAEASKPADQRDWVKIGKLATDIASSAYFTKLSAEHGLESTADTLARRAAAHLDETAPNVPPQAAPTPIVETARPPTTAPITADEVLDAKPPAEEKSAQPPVLKPALLINGQPVTGGNTHAEIYKNALAAATTKEQKIATLEAQLDDSKHVFVDQNGKVYNRMEATIDETQLAKTADALREITKSPFRPAGKAEVQMSKVNESNNQAKRKKGFTGMGAAVPEEFEQGQQSPTATKNAQVERERASRGLPPAIQPARRSFGRVWEQAMAAIDQNPEIQDELIAELEAKPRAVTDFENALLLQRQIALQNEYGKLTQDLAHAYDESKEFPNRLDEVAELKPRVASTLDRLFQLYEINKKVGTETGRGLNARKMMAYEDYTLAKMELDARASNGGRPLTEEEAAQVRELHDKIDKLRKEFDAYTAQAQTRISELEADQALRDIKANAEPPIEPHIRKLAERIYQKVHTQADAARERIKARRGRLTAGLDPTDLADHAIVGAEYITKGVIDFAEWSAAMVKEFGDYVKPHLKQIFEASNKEFNKQVSPQDAPKVKRAAKNKNAATTNPKEAVKDRIRARVDSGKRDEITPFVRRLARLYVEDGIDDRDELIDAVHSELMDIDPAITRRDTMDAISGYGDFKQLTKDEVSVQLRDLKGQMQQVAKLEDMQAGQPPVKTGLERRVPSKEESRLIKLVNEAKREFQIPITDPNTQLKSSLDTLKTRMQSRIDELQEKLATGDFSTRPPQKPLKLDEAALKIKANYERAKLEWQKALEQNRLKNRTAFEKATDTLVKWRRGFLLSSPITLAKLTSAAAQRMSFTPVEEAVGGVLSSVLPSVASKAAREGYFNSKAEAKAITEAFTKGMKDAWDVLTKGTSELDVLYGGGREGYVRESMSLPRSVIDFFGHIHGALKAPVKRAEFARAFEKRAASAIANGVDVSDPMVQTRLAVESYKDANAAIFLQDNRLVTAYKMFLAGLEKKNKETGKPTVGGKVAATAARIALPIVRVPTNIVAETFTYAFGSLSGGARLALAAARGFENLKPNEADLILRELKKGSLGAAFLLLGYFNPQSFGGYYQPGGQKRDEKDVKFGNVRLYGVDIPSFLVHNPLLETLQLGATIRRVEDEKVKGGQRGLPSGLMAGALGLSYEVPFMREMFGEIPKMFNPSEQGAFWGELGKSLLVPQVLQYAATATDKNAQGTTNQRKPATALQHIETGIPGLRQEVPLKNAPKSILSE